MRWNTKYPLGRLGAEQAKALALSKNDLLVRTGYRNLNRGGRAFDRMS